MLIRKVQGWPFFDDRLNGFSELQQMQRNLDRLLTGHRGERELDPSAGVYPLLNVTHDHDNFYIRSEIPGMTLEELDVSVTGRTVTVSGNREIQSEEQSARYHRREREAGKFRRQWNLPTDVDSEQVEAKYRHGMLMIVLPKAESAKPRKVTISG
ncbi:Hsp20/alpha crystallin family protein [Candidatus Nitrospira salsa]|nr:MAG: molecular chaperone [Nitrospirales bacterium]